MYANTYALTSNIDKQPFILSSLRFFWINTLIRLQKVCLPHFEYLKLRQVYGQTVHYFVKQHIDETVVLLL